MRTVSLTIACLIAATEGHKLAHLKNRRGAKGLAQHIPEVDKAALPYLIDLA